MTHKKEELDGSEVKTIISAQFEQVAKELGVEEFALFDGFYNEATNARAAVNNRTFRFNERYLGIDPQERERVIYHEIQHIQNYQQSILPFPESEMWRLFALHPLYLPIYHRMLSYYQKQKGRQYPFRKEVEPPPKQISDLGWANLNYADPDELLALLRGYERFLGQGGTQQVNIPYEPYEFIPAFMPEDLRLLDLNYRRQVAQEMIDKNPSILVAPHLPPVKIPPKQNA